MGPTSRIEAEPGRRRFHILVHNPGPVVAYDVKPLPAFPTGIPHDASGNEAGAARAAPVSAGSNRSSYSPSGRTVSLNVTSRSFGSLSLMS